MARNQPPPRGQVRAGPSTVSQVVRAAGEVSDRRVTAEFNETTGLRVVVSARIVYDDRGRRTTASLDVAMVPPEVLDRLLSLLREIYDTEEERLEAQLWNDAVLAASEMEEGSP